MSGRICNSCRTNSRNPAVARANMAEDVESARSRGTRGAGRMAS